MKVRERYPVTASDLLAIGGTKARLWMQMHPAPYASRENRVRRWPASARDRVLGELWGIVGRHHAQLRIIAITTFARAATIRAWGSYDAMLELYHRSVRTWAQLPRGREIEHLFSQALPRPLTLEAEETVTYPTKPKRRK